MIDIEEMAAQLATVPGVAAVTLGGSRARGEHRPDSDWDVGVYYREPIDLAGLRTLAAAWAGRPTEIAPPGGWGPWVNGGAWLIVDGTHVDWILRDLDRVLAVWRDCQQGRYEVGHQWGHPLGYWSPGYPGEVALSRVLADPGGELAALRRQTAQYPEPLRAALVAAAREAEFTMQVAAKTVTSGDVLYVSLCLSRAVGVLIQALFAWHRRWCLNEKGALVSAGRLPGAPYRFAERAAGLLAHPGHTPEALAGTVRAATALVTDTRAALAADPPPADPPSADPPSADPPSADPSPADHPTP